MCPAYLRVRWCTLWTLLFNFGLFSIPLGEISLAAHFPEVVLQSIICYRMPLSSAYPTLMCRIKLFNFAMWMSVYFLFFLKMPKNSFTVDGKPEMNSPKPETYQLCFDTIMKGKVGLWKLLAEEWVGVLLWAGCYLGYTVDWLLLCRVK